MVAVGAIRRTPPLVLATLAAALATAACGSGVVVATPSTSDAATTTAAAAASPIATPVSSTGSPQFTATIAGESGRPMTLTVIDHSGRVSSVRSATVAELQAHASALNDARAVFALLDPDHALVEWLGTACDVSATLDIGADWQALSLQQSPRPSCDLAGDPRGVVLVASGALPGGQPTISVSP